MNKASDNTYVIGSKDEKVIARSFQGYLGFIFEHFTCKNVPCKIVNNLRPFEVIRGHSGPFIEHSLAIFGP